MIPTFYSVGRLVRTLPNKGDPYLPTLFCQLLRAVEARLLAGSDEIDMSEWTGRAALEIIGQAGLGYSFDPLIDEQPNQYAAALKKFTYASYRLLPKVC